MNMAQTYFFLFGFVGFIFPLASGEQSSIKIGVLGYGELVARSRQIVDSCPEKDKIIITSIITDLSNGTSLLGQAEQLKNLISKEYLAVVGPLKDAVVLVTEDINVPYLVTNTETQLSYHSRVKNVYYVLPQFRDVIQCVSAIVKLYSWKSMAVLWERSSGEAVVTDFLELMEGDVKTFSVHSDALEHIRNTLHHIRQAGLRHIIMFTSNDVTHQILKMAKRIGVITVPYSYIILDNGLLIELSDMLDDLQTNITIVQMASNSTHRPLLTPVGQSATNLRAISDSISLMCELVMTSSPAELIELGLETSLEKARQMGKDLTVKFDGDKHRTGFIWDISRYSDYKQTQMARWVKTSSEEEESRLEFIDAGGKQLGPQWPKKKARVVTILEKPWAMLKEPSANCTGNSCFEGFVVDMMAEIARQAMFQPPIDYELYVVPDGLFGSFNPQTMEWNGLMSEIVSGNATLSLAPLSINKQREEAVDFTKPFKTRGITMLIKTPESYPSFFQFLAPLSYQVWAMILIAMVVMSVALGLYEKFGTRQRKDMLPITGQESCWFAFGTLVQEGTEVSPVTVAGRILTASWWFFAMILISSYTANLAAFLTVKKINSPIESISDLIGQTKIKYGTVKDSGVYSFFTTTEVEPYRTMALRMGPDSLVNNTSEALERVLQGTYAFLWDNTVNSYIAATDCRFTEIGQPFDHKGFGIGVPSGAIYRENLTLAILSLADSGVLDKLEEKWWKPSECHQEKDKSGQPSDTEELKLENVAGIFFILAAGLVLGLIACIFDRYTNVCATKQKLYRLEKQAECNERK